MIGMKQVQRSLLVVTFSLAAASAYGQAAPSTQKPFEPVSGQPGKDVVWVPTPQPTVDKMLELTKVTPRDYVVDLGSGNGITVISAAKKGATALGVEFNPEMVALALLPDINLRLRPKLLDLKPGTRIASNTFEMGDWEPDAQAASSPCTTYCTALAWVVPAKVAGTWRLEQQTLTLTQQYQTISGTLGSTPISDGKLNGEEITFAAGAQKYTGRVNGNTMSGSGWSATRM